VKYLRVNRDLVIDRIGRIPGLSITPVEATYLAWVGFDPHAIPDPVNFFEASGVGLYDGRAFGSEGYMRLNFGCPRSLLERALERMAVAMKTLSC